MRRVLCVALSVLLLTGILLTVSGCKEETVILPQPEDDVKAVISEFQTACNELNYDKVMTCLSPDINDAVGVASDVIGFFTDTDTKELFEILAKVLTSDWVVGMDFFESIQIQTKYVEMSTETSALVFSGVRYASGEIEKQEYVVFTCQQIEGKWYISAFEFV